MAVELPLQEGRVEGVRVEKAPFAPVDRSEGADEQPRPDHRVRRAKKPRPLREPSQGTDPARADDPDPHGSEDPVIFHEYSPSDTLEKSIDNAADMSGGDSEQDVVMMSFNWSCDVSTDGGASWRRLDPTTIFPEDLGGGFCCDQIVTHVREFDLFVWFLQYAKDASGQGAFRIAAATVDSVADDPTAWTYWDFVAGDFGNAATDMDYPDLAYSRQFLYASTDVFDPHGRLVLRIPLEQLAGGGTIDYQYTDPAQSSDAWGSHLVQQTAAQAVWFAHKDNSTLQVFTMPDSGNTYSSFDVHVAAWPNGTQSSTGPDGNDWLTKLRSFPKFAVTGGVEREGGNVVLAWTASNGSAGGSFDFPNTHARVVELDMGSRSVVSDMQVWNPDYAFAYPVLAVNARDEVAILLGWGGSANHSNCAMGILGDFVVWYRDDSTRTLQRFGDYLTTRPTTRNGNLFAGFAYFVTDVSGQPDRFTYHPIFTRYGRASA